MIQPFFSSMITLMMAKFIVNDMPHALLSIPSNPLSLTTVYLPLETQGAMINLLQREAGRTRLVEYGFGLLLKNSSLLPGAMKRGYRGAIGTLEPALGFFHTHPMNNFPPMFSETDTIDIFMGPCERVLGVGHPDYSTIEVSFITLTKAPPVEIIYMILDNLPGILDESVHMYELEEFYTTYNFTLGVQVLSMEVLLGWSPPKLPFGWWKPKETLEEYIQRKVPD